MAIAPRVTVTTPTAISENCSSPSDSESKLADGKHKGWAKKGKVIKLRGPRCTRICLEAYPRADNLAGSKHLCSISTPVKSRLRPMDWRRATSRGAPRSFHVGRHNPSAAHEVDGVADKIPTPPTSSGRHLIHSLERYSRYKRNRLGRHRGWPVISWKSIQWAHSEVNPPFA